jgi:hypothetical protein
MNIKQKVTKLFTALAVVLAFGSITASAQDRRDRDNNRGEIRKQQRQQSQQFNRAQMNRAQVNRGQYRSPAPQRMANNPGYRPRSWTTTRPSYYRPPVIYGGKRFYTYNDYYPHPFVSFSYGPRWHPVGFFLRALVGTAILIDLNNRSYRYSDGVFYEPYNNGYRVVPPPPGAYVPSIPQGYQQVSVGGQNYYYFGGAFFIFDGNNYQVVEAPAGAVVYNLPRGATQEMIDNFLYVQYNGTYYQPIQINGQDAYEVVQREPDNQPQPGQY